jgi:hypothetical protein
MSVGIGKNFFFNPVFAAEFRVNQTKSGNPGLEGSNFKFAVPLLFGKETVAIGYEHTHVAGTSHIDAGKINFIEDAVAESEPDAAATVQRRPNASLGAGGPARWNARPTGRSNI